MIYTVTFNPSIDYIVNVDNFMHLLKWNVLPTVSNADPPCLYVSVNGFHSNEVLLFLFYTY